MSTIQGWHFWFWGHVMWQIRSWYQIVKNIILHHPISSSPTITTSSWSWISSIFIPCILWTYHILLLFMRLHWTLEDVQVALWHCKWNYHKCLLHYICFARSFKCRKTFFQFRWEIIVSFHTYTLVERASLFLIRSVKICIVSAILFYGLCARLSGWQGAEL